MLVRVDNESRREKVLPAPGRDSKKFPFDLPWCRFPILVVAFTEAVWCLNTWDCCWEMDSPESHNSLHPGLVPYSPMPSFADATRYVHTLV